MITHQPRLATVAGAGSELRRIYEYRIMVANVRKWCACLELSDIALRAAGGALSGVIAPVVGAVVGKVAEKVTPAAGLIGRKSPAVAKAIGEFTTNEAIDRGAAKLGDDSSEDTGD